MIKSKKTTVVMAIVMSVAVFLIVFSLVRQDLVAEFSRRMKLPYEVAMDKTTVMSFEIIVDEKAWEGMLQNATAEEYIMADVVINGKRIKNVGIRPKGNSSLSTVAFDSTTDRYSFKIEFDHYVKGQTWLGLDKIALNNMYTDPTYMKEYLSYDILNYAGVNTPLYAFADISVNGNNWGFYIAVEGIEDSFINRNYSGQGIVYKPEMMGMRGDGRMNDFIGEMEQEGDFAGNRGRPNQIMGFLGGAVGVPEGNMIIVPLDEEAGEDGMQRMEIAGIGNAFATFDGGVSLKYVDDEIASYSAIFGNAKTDAKESDYVRVINALKNLSESNDIEKYVDVEATLRYIAGHTVVVNLDSYSSGMGHNYYLYENNGRITMLPWDYNMSFGGFMSGDASATLNFPIDTPVSAVSLEDRPLIGKLLEVEEYMDMYHQYLQDIVDGYFNSGLYEETITYLDNMISSYVENDPSAFSTYEEYRAGVEALLEVVKRRGQSIEGQLAGTIPSTTEGQSANPELLISSEGIDIGALGSMGGGMAIFRIDGNEDNIWRFNEMQMDGITDIGQAMEILMQASGRDLTPEETSKLNELGMDQESIDQFRGMTNFQPGMNQRVPGQNRGGGMAPGMQRTMPEDGGANQQIPQNTFTLQPISFFSEAPEEEIVMPFEEMPIQGTPRGFPNAGGLDMQTPQMGIDPNMQPRNEMDSFGQGIPNLGGARPEGQLGTDSFGLSPQPFENIPLGLAPQQPENMPFGTPAQPFEPSAESGMGSSPRVAPEVEPFVLDEQSEDNYSIDELTPEPNSLDGRTDRQLQGEDGRNWMQADTVPVEEETSPKENWLLIGIPLFLLCVGQIYVGTYRRRKYKAIYKS